MPLHHVHYSSATVAGVLNASAASDEEARRNIVRTFVPLLFLVYVCDIAGCIELMRLQCAEEENHGVLSHCVVQQLRVGLHFTVLSSSSFGDFFWLAVIRCLVTTVLLLLGVQFGSYSQKNCTDSEESTTATTRTTGIDATQQQETTDSTAAALTEPLLPSRTSTSSSDDDNNNNIVSSLEAQAPPDRQPSPQKPWWNRRPEPSTARNLSLVALFVASTAYQVYAGLKVSTYHPHHDDDDSSSSSSTITATFKIVLMCLTVLWINAGSYLFRILLLELTREKGLFLPPAVHHHPVFYAVSRGLALHWCDICRQPIKAAAASTTTSSTAAETAGCYRCALCDFDVCLPCAARSDTAVVGENLLRGDRGARAETAMSWQSYAKRSLQVARAELSLLMLSFGLLAASSVSTLLLPHFQGAIIDKVIPDASGNYDKEGFAHYVRLYLYLMLFQGALATLYSAIFTLVSRRLKFHIRNALLERILAQDVAYFDGTESERLISRLTNDLDLMMAPIQSSLSSLLSSILLLFGGMTMCFIKSYRLSMLAFVTVGPITYLWDQYAQWSKQLAREMLAYWAEGNSIASQALSHIRTVKAFGCEQHVVKKYTDTNQQALTCGVKDAVGNAVTSALTGYLDLGSGVLILWFGGRLVYQGEMSVGELVTFQLFWNMMNNAYQNLQGLVTSFTRSAAGAEKIFSLWDSRPDIDNSTGSEISAANVRGDLEFQNVKFFYQMRPDNIVLDHFNLTIPAGKTVALVGRSGGGKSTIINLLLRFYDAKEGNVLIDGREYTSLKVDQLRRLFGVVTQETELFALTVEENIAYGLDKDKYTIADVVAAAKKAFAHDFICEMKDGYQTRIGERGNRLSGGQRQRLAIARVFLRRPKLILLDEATSALDENSQEAVQEALSTLIAESHATVVLVAHRLSTVKNADSIVVIDKGVTLEQGNHEELMARGGIYASMVQKHDRKRADLLDQEKQSGDPKDKKPVDDIDSLMES